MNAFKISHNSWHFKLIKWSKLSPWTNFGDYATRFDIEMFYKYLPEDFCTYWKMFLFGILKILFHTALAVGIITLIGFTFFVSISTLINDPVSFFIGLGIITVPLGFLMFVAFLINYIDRTRGRNMKFKEDGLIVTRYKSFKEKYCPMVQYDEKIEEISKNFY